MGLQYSITAIGSVILQTAINSLGEDAVTAVTTAGKVNMFGDFYASTFDGDVFESAYTRVEGIRDGNLKVTLKKDQPIWPEWTDEDSAEDQNGEKYELTDKGWFKEEEMPMKSGA